MRRGAAALLLALAGASSGLTPASAQAPAGGPPAIPVSVATVQRQDVPIYLRGLGIVVAHRSVLVRARVDGTLDHVNFTEGQEVRPGDLLAEIDPRPYQAVLDQALARKAADQALLTSARADLDRYTRLAKEENASRQKLENVTAVTRSLEAAIQGDDAAIATARLNLEFTRIVSPIPGRVGLRLVDPGNLVRAAEAAGIVTIMQTRPISLVFTVPQDRLPAIMTAMAKRKLAVIAWSADDKTELGAGELLTPDNTIDPATGTIKLKAAFPNDNNALWPGQFANARLLLRTLPNALTVPTTAVQHSPGGLFVYVVKPDLTVSRQEVTLALADGPLSVIASGVEDGARVVVTGQSRLQNASRVSISPTTQPDSAAPDKPKETGS